MEISSQLATIGDVPVSPPRAGFACLAAVVGLGLATPERAPPPAIDIIARGAHPASVAAVRGLLSEMRLTARLQERLREARLSIVIVPRRVPLTDVPQFASLRGTRTFDGRLWDRVRGTGGMRLLDGRVGVAIPEENLFGFPDDVYPSLAIAVHEIAHAIHDRVLTAGDKRAIELAYRARIKSGEAFTDNYARSNVREYFAQGANAFFGRYPGREYRDAAWLYEHDRPLYTALVRVFGAPRPGPVTGRT